MASNFPSGENASGQLKAGHGACAKSVTGTPLGAPVNWIARAIPITETIETSASADFLPAVGFWALQLYYGERLCAITRRPLPCSARLYQQSLHPQSYFPRS